jgi:16S rRNA (guanine1516-N2)-methyltransferase
MFFRPVLHSQPLSPLRQLADHAALNPGSVREACRVARRRVVLKSQAAEGEFERLGFARVVGSKHNPIAYGIIAIR